MRQQEKSKQETNHFPVRAGYWVNFRNNPYPNVCKRNIPKQCHTKGKNWGHKIERRKRKPLGGTEI